MAGGRGRTGRSGPGEALGSPLAMIPRTVYAQTQPLSSSSSLRGGDLLCGKIPSWASPSEREEARGRGWDSQGHSVPLS